MNHALRARAKRIWQAGGFAFSVLALFYVAGQARAHRDLIAGWSASAFDIAVIALSGAVCGTSILILALNWRLFLEHLSGKPLSRRNIYSNYCITQLGKYIPGNVMHYLSRHVSLAASGLSQKHLAGALAGESAALIVAATGLATVGLWTAQGHEMFAQGFFTDLPGLAPLSTLLWATLAGASAYVARRVLGLWPAFLARVTLLYALFFAVQTALFVLLGVLVTGDWLIGAVVAVPLAWVAGFVVPGAPAGLGIREVFLMAMLGHVVPAAQALLIIALFRLVTFSGDIAGFLIGWILRNERRL